MPGTSVDSILPWLARTRLPDGHARSLPPHPVETRGLLRYSYEKSHLCHDRCVGGDREQYVRGGVYWKPQRPLRVEQFRIFRSERR